MGHLTAGPCPLSPPALVLALSVWWRGGVARRIRAVSRTHIDQELPGFEERAHLFVGQGRTCRRAVSLWAGGGHRRNRLLMPRNPATLLLLRGAGLGDAGVGRQSMVIGCNSLSLAFFDIYIDVFRYLISVFNSSAFARASTPACAGQYPQPRLQGQSDGWGAGGACPYIAPYSG